MSKHTGEYLFNCPLCEYKCNRKNNLQRHIRRKHNGVFSLI